MKNIKFVIAFLLAIPLLQACEDFAELEKNQNKPSTAEIIDYYTNNKLRGFSSASKKIYDENYSYDKVSEQLNYIINKAVETSVFKKKNDSTK